jgi:hypothetical protein
MIQISSVTQIKNFLIKNLVLYQEEKAILENTYALDKL